MKTNRVRVLTILRGAGSVLDLGAAMPRPYPRRWPAERSDAEAIADDWAAVGQDLWVAMKKYSEERDRTG